MKSKRSISVSAALLLTVLLAGCSASTNSPSVLEPVAAAVTPTGSPTQTAIPGDTNADGTLSEFEKQKVAKSAVRSYTLPDGSSIDVDPSQPLPDAVVAALQAQASPIAQSIRFAEGDATIQPSEAMRASVEEQAALLDRGITYVFQALSDDGSGPLSMWMMVASNIDVSPVVPNPEMSVTLAAAQGWASTRNYEVITIQ